MNLIPKPNGTYEQKPGFFSFEKKIPLDCGGFAPYCTEAFAARLKPSGYTLTGAGGPGIALVRDPGLQEEAYSLDAATDGITVKAASEQGVILALTSLFLLWEQPVGVSCFHLEDAPRYSHRAIHLDCSRHFFQAEEIERVIEQMSLAKLNTMHWHLSDDQGWRIESKVFPRLAGLNGQPYYTQEEIRHVIGFAKARGIIVTPEVDIPGHTSALIASYPELSCKGVAEEMTGAFAKVILCPGKEKVYAFLEKLFDELCALFDSPYFHAGGDEVQKDEWKTCPDCKAMMEREGITDYEDLQGYFCARVAAMLKARGKTPVFWNDTLKSPRFVENAASSGTVIQYWAGMFGTAELERFFSGGGKTIFSDMFFLYFDYPECFNSLKRVYDYTPHIESLDCADGSNTLGLEACLWTEQVVVPETLQTRLFPRLLALAEAAWSRERDYAGFEQRLLARLESLKAAGIAFVPQEGWNPTGKAKREGVRRHLAGFMDAPGPKMPAKEMAALMKTIAKAFMKGFGLSLLDMALSYKGSKKKEEN